MNDRRQAMRTTAAMPSAGVRRFFPMLGWAPSYRREYLVGDVTAGVIVAIMLVPQAMAYAMLAGLPAEVGLYASILPLVLYALMGTSRVLAVGPVAMVSLLVAFGVQEAGAADAATATAYALVLAALVGLLQLGMGLLRVGFITNYLSHPVLSGFTSAAALLIGFSQVKHLLGVSVPRHEHFYENVLAVWQVLGSTNRVTLALAAGSILLLVAFRTVVGPALRAVGMASHLVDPMTKAAPLFVVALSTMAVVGLDLAASAGVRIVGDIPGGLPGLTMPSLDWTIWRALLPTALLISFVGFMESASVARALASKRRQRIDPDQELVALGAANLGAAVTGGYPVTGGFSRSVVNFAAGANTGLASLITAALIAVAVIFLTPLFYYLPNAALAAIIIVAVAGLMDFRGAVDVWRYSGADGFSLAITFIAVLALGIESGILVGAATAAALYLWRTSKPHTAIVGRVGSSEHFRNVNRHEVHTLPGVLAMRVDESLYYANTRYLEDRVLREVAACPDVTDLLLICSAVNFIDGSALETLESLHEELSDAGVALSLAELKGPVMDRLDRIGFIDRLGRGRVYLSTYEAWQALVAIRS
jgi:SulP family sulfate permease